MNKKAAKVALINEARILGHAEAKTYAKRGAAASLIGEGKLVVYGHLGDKNRTPCYRLTPDYQEKMRAKPGGITTEGPRVRFLVDNLAASEPENMMRCTGDEYGIGDSGIVAFEHLNPKVRKGWVYVEVDSKSGPARKLYVGVGPDMYEPEDN